MSNAVDQSRVPKLRFPEFEGEWEEKQLSTAIRSLDAGVSTNSIDRPSDKSELGVLKTSCVTAGKFEPMKNKAVLEQVEIARLREPVQAGTIIISRMNTPALVGANAYVEEDAPNLFLPDRLWAAKVLDGANARWLSVLTGSAKFRSRLSARATGTSGSMKNLTKKDLLSLRASIPKPNEQEKVGNFLRLVDARQDFLARRQAALAAYKKGMMQRLFSTELRFTRDDGSPFPDWHQKRLGEIGERVTEKNVNEVVTKVLTNSAVQGIVSQQDYFDKDIANESNLGGYYVVRAGDFVYNPRISVTAPVGPIKRSAFEIGVMSPLYTVFRFNDQNDQFFEQYFAGSVWFKYLKAVANYGARHDRMAITTGDFMAMPLPYPHLEEQQKIADFLSALDAKIDAVASQIDAMQRFKKSLLQQMFV